MGSRAEGAAYTLRLGSWHGGCCRRVVGCCGRIRGRAAGAGVAACRPVRPVFSAPSGHMPSHRIAAWARPSNEHEWSTGMWEALCPIKARFIEFSTGCRRALAKLPLAAAIAATVGHWWATKPPGQRSPVDCRTRTETLDLRCRQSVVAKGSTTSTLRGHCVSAIKGRRRRNEALAPTQHNPRTRCAWGRRPHASAASGGCISSGARGAERLLHCAPQPQAPCPMGVPAGSAQLSSLLLARNESPQGSTTAPPK